MKGMSGNAMVAALNQENRMLRQKIADIEADRAQGSFLEELTCAAVAGFTSSSNGLTDREIAKRAIDVAEAVLQNIVQSVREAAQPHNFSETQEPADPADVAAEADVDESSGLILET